MQVNSPKLAKGLKAKSGEFLQASMLTPVHVVAIYLAISAYDTVSYHHSAHCYRR